MDNSIIKLYHGSKNGLKGNIKPISREGNILMNSSQNKEFHTLSQFERQLCSVQGKMFELYAKKSFSNKEFIDFYMQSKTAQFLIYPMTERNGSAKKTYFRMLLTKQVRFQPEAPIIQNPFFGLVIHTATGIFLQVLQARKYLKYAIQKQ